METPVTLHLTKAEARALLTRVIEEGGRIEYLGHALEEMLKDGLAAVDVVKALAGGEVGVAYKRKDAKGNESWRHTVTHKRCDVVISFHAVEQIIVIVVTAWRNK
jgi:hypothetical protein